MFAELQVTESECKQEAVSENLSPPSPLTAQKLCDEIRKVEINKNALDTAATLQRNGMKDCLDNWCISKFSIESGNLQRPILIYTRHFLSLKFFPPQGIKTGVVANIWVDDSPQRDSVAKILSVLESCFDVVVRSCHTGSRLPEPEIFHTALDALNVKPNQACTVTRGPVFEYDHRAGLT